jgi:hypothetical protein
MIPLEYLERRLGRQAAATIENKYTRLWLTSLRTADTCIKQVQQMKYEACESSPMVAS